MQSAWNGIQNFVSDPIGSLSSFGSSVGNFVSETYGKLFGGKQVALMLAMDSNGGYSYRDGVPIDPTNTDPKLLELSNMNIKNDAELKALAEQYGIPYESLNKLYGTSFHIALKKDTNGNFVVSYENDGDRFRNDGIGYSKTPYDHEIYEFAGSKIHMKAKDLNGNDVSVQNGRFYVNIGSADTNWLDVTDMKISAKDGTSTTIGEMFSNPAYELNFAASQKVAGRQGSNNTDELTKILKPWSPIANLETFLQFQNFRLNDIQSNMYGENRVNPNTGYNYITYDASGMHNSRVIGSSYGSRGVWNTTNSQYHRIDYIFDAMVEQNKNVKPINTNYGPGL
ncbi:hypothetical protein EHQ13_06240 [Leptospira gomenensis]|nr:hypothetical protein EHQ13_06240 [Leptospira gomenensis]